MEFSTLLDLQEAIERDGLGATTDTARLNAHETLGCLSQALEEGLNPELAKSWGAFAVVFETVILGDSGASVFTLLWQDEQSLVLDYGIPEPRATLRAPLKEMLYICAGTQRDTSVYRARILKWQGAGTIQATGDQVLVQALQGMFL